MTHNENIKIFDDISRHLELEEESLEATKSSDEGFVAESSKVGASHFKWKKKNDSKMRKKNDLETKRIIVSTNLTSVVRRTWIRSNVSTVT